MNKKNFCQNGIEYTVVYGLCNYLEYKVQYKKTEYYKRKRVYKGFHDAKNILELYNLALIYIEKNKQINCVPPPANDLILYLETNKYRLKERTFQQFLGVVNRYCIWCETNKIKPLKITFNQLQKYISELTAKGIQNNTIFNIVLVLKSVYNGLIKEKKLNENVFLLLPKIKRAPVSLKYFNAAQIEIIKKHCAKYDAQLWLAIQVMFCCGVRPSELRLLKIWDFNLTEGYIEIKGEVSKNGKNQKVIIPEFLKSKLYFLDNYPAHYFLFGIEGTPSDTKVGVNYFNKRHKKVLEDNRIIGKYGFYSWKHTGAVMAVKKGMNLKEMQLQFRHSSLAMFDEYLKNMGVMDSDAIRYNYPTI